jgi:hypothetical protein
MGMARGMGMTRGMGMGMTTVQPPDSFAPGDVGYKGTEYGSKDYTHMGIGPGSEQEKLDGTWPARVPVRSHVREGQLGLPTVECLGGLLSVMHDTQPRPFLLPCGLPSPVVQQRVHFRREALSFLH